MSDDLKLALSLADDADQISMRHFGGAYDVRTKADATPVSEVDLAIEKAIRERLSRERSADGVIGEEFGSEGSGSRRWIIDPIDATRNYIRHLPVFATLIALEEDGRIACGVVSAPALHRRWWAVRGAGAFCNGVRIHVSAIDALGESHISFDDLQGFTQAGLEPQFLRLLRECARARAFGDFWSHMLVAEGAMDIAIEPQVALWDLAAIQVIVEQAGGRFSALSGEATPAAGSAVSTNGLLHDKVLTALRPGSF